MSWELPDPRRDEDERELIGWDDPDRRDAALERVLLRTAGYMTRNNRASGRELPYLLPQRSRPVTPRQLQVIEAVSHGMGARGAAELLGITYYTAKCHLRDASRLMAAKDRTHLVALCLRARLIL